ncbi:hypothetical protein PWT90_07707 [Aphanocladium album]|nr:hypothetical protein PWT90_07707 [Aphanocladium album]
MPSIRLSDDLLVHSQPLQQPDGSSPRVIVVGAGVAGLTTAWFLLDRGYHVTILSKEWPTLQAGAQRLTSQIAGALWELPPTQCGQVSNLVSQTLTDADRARLEQWAIESFQIYEAMAALPELSVSMGVRMKMFTSFLTRPIEEDEPTAHKIRRLEASVPGGIRRGVDLVAKYGANINVRGGLKDAYEHLAPIIDTDTAMLHLLSLVQDKGAVLHTRAMHGDLRPQERDLLDAYKADAIVNASGVGAADLASDSHVLPVRGALLRVINDGSAFPKIDNAMIVSAETRPDGRHESMAFVVPRTDGILVMGSIEQPRETQLDLTPESAEVRQIRERCEQLLPVLKGAELDAEYPLAQGLRPYRTIRLRVERESSLPLDSGGGGGGGIQAPSRIVHCYGHGGGGWSAAFGASRECARLVDQVVTESSKHMSRPHM